MVAFLMSPLGRRIIKYVLLNGMGVSALGLTCPPAVIVVGVVLMVLPTVAALFKARHNG